MKYIIIFNNDYDLQDVCNRLEKTCNRLKSQGFTILNCQYINAYKIVVFYFE